MKSFLLLVILSSAISIHSFSQSNSDSTKRHRFWINPTQIITGQYTLAYSYNLHGGNDWLEVGIGYQYLPYSFAKRLPFSSSEQPISTPKYGMGFTGPAISIATEKFYTKVKKGTSKGAEHDPHLQEMIKNAKPLNSIRYEFQYQYLWHQAACYYAGEANSYTYSSIMNNISAEALFSKILRDGGNHVIWQSYIGIGAHFGFGNETRYTYTTLMNGGYDQCVQDIHDPNVVATKVFSGYFFPMLQIGIRMGFQ